MRHLLKSAGVAAIGMAAFGFAGAASAETLTIVSWGGAYTKSQLEAYHKPWMAKTGDTLNSEDYNGGLAEIRAQVEAGNVTWDLVDVELSDAVRGCDEGILEVLDTADLPKGDDGTPAAQDFIQGAVHECSVATIVWSTVYAYDKTKFKEGPTTIADFFDLKKFPGKRGMRKTPKANLEFALMADGVPADKVYETLATPKGVERAFAKLATIKNDTIWWEAGAQPPQLLADGEVVMTTAYNGRLFNAIANEKKPFEIVWDGQVWDLDLWAIPRGAKNKARAWEFIKFSTDTQRLADQAKWISYGPVRKSSFPKVQPEMQPHMPTAPGNFKNPLQNDFEFWADYGDELNERFNAWLAS